VELAEQTTAILQTIDFSKSLSLAYTPLATGLWIPPICTLAHKGQSGVVAGSVTLSVRFQSAHPPLSFTSFFLGSFDFFMDALDRLEVLDRFDAQL
jgi:hypothetical protein